MLKCTPLRYFIVGLRQLRVPQRLIVAVSVTLRYFPAIREEMGYIRDAMKLRDVRGLARLEGTVIPLGWRRALCCWRCHLWYNKEDPRNDLI